jgi:thioredoxin reductase
MTAGNVKKVWLLARRGSLEATMSSYLVERIKAQPNIEVLTRSEVTALEGCDGDDRADLHMQRKRLYKMAFPSRAFRHDHSAQGRQYQRKTGVSPVLSPLRFAHLTGRALT